jgi:hypothetical protein
VQVVVGLLEACAHADKRLGLVPSFGSTVTLDVQLYVAQGFSSGEVSPPGRQAGGWEERVHAWRQLSLQAPPADY